MNDDIDEILERKAIEVEHWDPAVAQAAFDYYKAKVEKRKGDNEDDKR